MDQLYRRYAARLIIPLHDASIFAASLKELKKAAGLTARVKSATPQARFLVRRPL